MRASAARKITEFDEARALNHELAALVSWAFHSPKKMPKFKALADQKKTVEMPDEAAQIYARQFFIALATRE